jgi:hypothetical protein
MFYDEAEGWLIGAAVLAAVVAAIVAVARRSPIAWITPLVLASLLAGACLGIELTAGGTLKLPVGVVARQFKAAWDDYCGDRDPARCAVLRELTR